MTQRYKAVRYYSKPKFWRTVTVKKINTGMKMKRHNTYFVLFLHCRTSCTCGHYCYQNFYKALSFDVLVRKNTPVAFIVFTHNCLDTQTDSAADDSGSSHGEQVELLRLRRARSKPSQRYNDWHVCCAWWLHHHYRRLRASASFIHWRVSSRPGLVSEMSHPGLAGGVLASRFLKFIVQSLD